MAVAVLATGCGGGGGGGGATQPPPVTLNCGTNKIPVGGSCQCPAGLVENMADGYCTDVAGTVLRGAEYLEQGFPTSAFSGGGFGHGPLYVKAGNIDDDPEYEIVYKHVGTVWNAWNHDGTLVPGFPLLPPSYLHGKLIITQLDTDASKELFIAHEGTARAGEECMLNGLDGAGQLLPGYPVFCPNGGDIYVQPVAVDFDSDGVMELLFINDRRRITIFEGGAVRFFSPDYSAIPGYRIDLCGLSAADLNKNGFKEVIALTCPIQDPMTGLFYHDLYVFDKDGAEVSGFPVRFSAFREHQPLIGDVDGDQELEIIAVNMNGIIVISATGAIEAEIDRVNIGVPGFIGATDYPFLALADIDGSGTPEIVFQQGNMIHAIKPSGDEIAGFPVDGYVYFAVGDVDGDNLQEIVTFRNYETALIDDPRVHLTVFGNDGSQQNFDVLIDQVGDPGSMMPTIADIDNDGHNEVIVAGDYWNGASGDYYKIWVFDFGGPAHGRIEWGQMYGNDDNTGEYHTALMP